MEPLQQDLKEQPTLTVRCPGIEQIRDDPRQPEFVASQVVEHVEPTCEMAVEIPLQGRRRFEPRTQLREKDLPVARSRHSRVLQPNLKLVEKALYGLCAVFWQVVL